MCMLRVCGLCLVTATALSPNSGRSVHVATAAASNPQMAAFSSGYIPTNAASVAYFDESGQVLLVTNFQCCFRSEKTILPNF